MGREVRRVPADWAHPKRSNSQRPLLSGYKEDSEEFREMVRVQGLEEANDYFGGAPDPYYYMPEWSEEKRTHYQMYETCSEGTPISPVMDTPEALAKWLADNGASTFASMTTDYDTWLHMIKGHGSSISAVITNGQMVSGVDALE